MPSVEEKMGFTRQQIFDIEQVISNALSKEDVTKTFLKTVTVALTDNLKDLVASAVADAIKTAVSGLQTKIDVLTAGIDSLKSDNINLEKKLEGRMTQMEQYSRRNNLRVFGVQEEDGENVEDKLSQIFTTKLQVQLPGFAIDRAHRIGKVRNGAPGSAPRAIIVKFVSYKYKDIVFRAKKLLKNTKILITEDLAHGRMEVFSAAKLRFGQENVWTRDGAIIIKTGQGIRKIHTVEQLSDVKNP